MDTHYIHILDTHTCIFKYPVVDIYMHTRISQTPDLHVVLISRGPNACIDSILLCSTEMDQRSTAYGSIIYTMSIYMYMYSHARAQHN